MHSSVTSYVEESRLRPGATEGPATIRCKFVVIDIRGALTLVVGPVDRFPYHADLVNRFCSDQGIASSWVKRPDHVEIHESGVRIRGGGHLRMERRKRLMILGGVSRAYGSFPSEDVKRIVTADPFFRDFTVSVQ
jgi:hypothetical protein